MKKQETYSFKKNDVTLSFGLDVGEKNIQQKQDFLALLKEAVVVLETELKS